MKTFNQEQISRTLLALYVDEQSRGLNYDMPILDLLANCTFSDENQDNFLSAEECYKNMGDLSDDYFRDMMLSVCKCRMEVKNIQIIEESIICKRNKELAMKIFNTFSETERVYTGGITIAVLDEHSKYVLGNKTQGLIFNNVNLILVDGTIENETEFIFILLHELRHHFQQYGQDKELRVRCEESHTALEAGKVSYVGCFHEYDANTYAKRMVERMGLEMTPFLIDDYEKKENEYVKEYYKY